MRNTYYGPYHSYDQDPEEGGDEEEGCRCEDCGELISAPGICFECQLEWHDTITEHLQDEGA